ncbi:hypothetical protein caldi_15200 [Caldinitratiruptor microaerophilus]|uniref:Uncharacterized protein n=1 Tax=Caldinitratiruptor microaerophilus TaxID=671077 RepID=A0AA35CN98_9FIRM|nr:hypothetical protein caldi_15200 [Caldinitratiruptor microaerophilus]
MVIYHAVRPLPARIAAALHLCPAGDAPASPASLLPDLAGQERTADLLRPQAGMRLEGVDPAGTRVYSCATGAAPAVVERAFAGMARVCGIPPSAYRLVAVHEPPWAGAVLAALGLAGARRAVSAYARLAGRAAAEAVRRGRGDGGAGA